ncbi:hypothetical protein MNBD_NITROSPINAE04-638 [hydrothermal vent metagenome]|uniref:General secretion pathway GspH domain-containing protein n=1 Tax=hydrothermal vent metagenome TaxID=652676 RepID=A0A3B1BXH6_9ZZZZ
MIRKKPGGLASARGFTMIELMVVIGILGVLIAAAVSSLSGNLPKMRLKGATNDVVQKFQKARGVSVKRNLPVIVTLANANDTSASSITIFVDEDRSGSVNSGDTQIDSVTIPSNFASAYMVSFKECDTASDPMTVTFNSRGYIEDVNGGGKGKMPIVITLTSQAPTNPVNFTVVVERSGIARLVSGDYSPGC